MIKIFKKVKKILKYKNVKPIMIGIFAIAVIGVFFGILISANATTVVSADSQQIATKYGANPLVKIGYTDITLSDSSLFTLLDSDSGHCSAGNYMLNTSAQKDSSNYGLYWIYNNAFYYNGKYIDVKVTLNSWTTSSTYYELCVTGTGVGAFFPSGSDITIEFFEAGTTTPVTITSFWTNRDVDAAERFYPVSGFDNIYYGSKLSWNGSYIYNTEGTATENEDTGSWMTSTFSTSSLNFKYASGGYTVFVLYSLVPIAESTPVKTVSMTSTTTGSEVTYTITQSVPNEYTDNYYSSFTITDTLATMLTWATSNVKVTNELGINKTSLFNISKSGSTLTVSATSDALSSSSFYGHTYTVTITATVNDTYSSSYTSSSGTVFTNTATRTYKQDGTTYTDATNTTSTIVTYKITTSATNASITSSMTGITGGSFKTITYTPNKGYYISSLIVDGSSASYTKTGGTYTFSNISADHTIKAVASPYLFTLKGYKIDSETGGTAQGDATLGGATIAVYYHQGYYDTASEEPYSEGEIVCWATTNSDGSFTCPDQLRAGNYEIVEVSAPTGYKLNSTSYTFTHEDDSTFEYTISDEVYKYTLYLKKVMSDGDTGITTQEEGATFDIYLKSSGEYVTTITTDENGEASVTLPYGVYTAVQTSGTENYYLVDDFDVTLKTEDLHLTLNNGAETAKIKITKTDSETSETVPLAGITFKIWSVENNDYVCQAITYPTTTILCEFETDENGIMTTPYELDPGNYIIYEVDQAIDGYLWNSEGVEVFIGDGMAVFLDETYGNILSVNFENTPVKGQIEIYKYGQRIVYNNTNYSYDYKLTGGIKFGVYAREDIVSGTGKLMYSAGDLVTVIQTDSTGYAIAENLYLGKYYLKEISTQKYYVLDETEYDFELTYEDQYTSPVSADGQTLYNDYKEGTLTFIKTDTDTGETLEGVTIDIYREQDDGSYVMIYEGVTDSVGQAIATLPYGNYYIIEKSTVEGYVLSEEKVYFSITDTDVDASLTNDKIKGTMVFTKVDNYGNALAGVTIEVRDSDGELYATLVTDEYGQATLENVVYGTYTVQEVEALEGYVLNSEVQTFSITTNGETIILSLTNNRIIGNILVTTVDAKTYEIQPGDTVCLYDFNYTMIECQVSDENGQVYFKDVEYGTYYVLETDVIEGYLLNEDILTFSIIDDGERLEGIIPNIPIKGNIEVTIIDEDTEEPLIGTVCLYDSEGNELSCYEDSNLTFEDIPYGEYTIKETETPEGYNPNKTVYEVSITENGVTLTYQYTHVRITGNLEFTKTDVSNGNVMEGVTIEVYTSENELIATLVTDSDGKAYLEGLEYGSYYIIETETLENYDLYTEKLYFAIESQDKTVTVDLANEPYTLVEFYDKDRNDLSILLPEGNVCIYTSEGTLVTSLTFDENGYASIQLPKGDYYYIQTIAPEGYDLNIEIGYFSITSNNSIMQIDVLNDYTVIEVPNTNISNTSLIFIAIATIIGTSLIICSFKIKNKTEKDIEIPRYDNNEIVEISKEKE